MKTLLFTLFACSLFLNTANAQTSLLADVQAERSTYPAHMERGQVADMLNAVAWKHRNEGWGLLRKGSGNSCPLKDTFISCDILVHAPSVQHFDVLIDSEDAAIPVWNNVGPCVLGPSSGCAMSNFLSPFDPGGVTPIPVPVPVPVPVPGVDLGPLLRRLEVLEEDVKAQRGALDNFSQTQANLSRRVQTIEDVLIAHRIPVSCSASVFGIGVSCKLVF